MIKAIIVDDEKDARESLQLILDQFYQEEVDIVASVGSVKEAIKAINVFKPDLVFLDIEMPGENGLQLFGYFGEEVEFEVVITTAYQDYALQSYRYAAIDYLLKPIDAIQLGETLQRVKRKTRTLTKLRIETFISNVKNELEINKKVIFPVKNGYQVLKINNILYCQADINYSIIYTLDNTSFTIATTLKNLEERLPDKVFFRTHKSFLINMNYIKTYDKSKDKIILENNIEVDIATRRVEHFLQTLTNR